MKFLYISLLALILTTQLYAQAPNSFNYQGVARDASGIVLPNQGIGLRFTIHQGSAGGTIVYRETQSATTNLLGLFTVAVGSGALVSGSFTTIGWGTNTEYLQVEMDPTTFGGTSYLDMGTNQFLSVPYALNSGSSSTGWNFTGNTGINNPAAPATYGTSAFGATENWLGTTDSKDLTFGTGGIERMRLGGGTVATAGFLGIGKSAPAQMLDVAGNVQFSKALMPNGNAGTSGYVLQSAGANAPPTWVALPSGWSLTGNSIATTAGTNFIGTTNNMPLVFKINNTYTSIMDPGDANIYLGAGAVAGLSVGNFQAGATANFTGGYNNVGIGAGALGSLAPASTTPGQNYDEVAIGYGALLAFNPNNSQYNSSTAVGGIALRYATTGTPNDAFGYGALYNLTTGTNNVAIGYQALNGGSNNATMSFNTGVGDNTLATLTTGTYNTALGYKANVGSAALTNSTAIGANATALASNQVVLGAGTVTQVGFNGALAPYYSGAYQSGTSGQVLTSGGAGVAPTWATPSGGGSAWLLTGNPVAYNYSATPTNYIGTTNTYGFQFGVNGANAGRVEANFGNQNTSLGWGTLNSHTSGADNVAMGLNAMALATGGAYNVAIGWESYGDYTTGGTNNTALGSGALAGPGSATGAAVSNNTAVGYEALVYDIAGNNTAVGYEAAFGNVTTNITGTPITAMGYQSLFSITSGTNNAALGYQSLYNTSSGSFNTAIGDNALKTNTTGTNNTAVGYNANVASAALTNATAIGNGATVSASNTMVLGNNSVTALDFNGALAPYYGGVYNTGTTGQLLQSNGAGVAPSWINPATSAGTAGGVNYGTGAGSAYTTAGASGQVLQSTGTGAPIWVNVTALGATGDNWGSQVAVTDSFATSGVTNTINGNGAALHPLTIAQQGATTGQVLTWNGSKWVPGGGASWGLTGNSSITNPAAPATYGTSTFGAGENYVGTTDSKDLTFGTGNIERMRIGGGTVATAGFVGIGKSAPAQVLDVAGNVQFSKALMPNGQAGTSGQILQSAGANAPPTWVAVPSSGWALTGNTVAYTASASPTNYVGTVSGSGAGFQFAVGGVNAGRIEGGTTANFNTAIGNQAMNAGAGGSRNSAFGNGTLAANSSGIQNTAVGNHALFVNTSGSYNVGIGQGSLTSLVSGTYNVAMGWQSMANASQTNGSYNVALGGGALAGGAGAATNDATAVGYEALVVSLANNNSAVGYESQFDNTTGTPNTSIGYESLYTNSTGADNVAVGNTALFNNTASQNTAVGDNALKTNTTGTSNTAIGYNANVAGGALTNATAIGANAVAVNSNTVILGDSTHNVNVGIGTGAPASDAGLGIKGLHIETRNGSTAATVAAQSGAGTSATASFGANGGTDVGGGVSVTTGSASYATGAQVTVTFAKVYIYAPTVVLTPTDATSALAMNGQQIYVSSTTTGFSINFGVAASAAATYNFNYFVIETK